MKRLVKLVKCLKSTFINNYKHLLDQVDYMPIGYNN